MATLVTVVVLGNMTALQAQCVVALEEHWLEHPLLWRSWQRSLCDLPNGPARRCADGSAKRR